MPLSALTPAPARMKIRSVGKTVSMDERYDDLLPGGQRRLRWTPKSRPFFVDNKLMSGKVELCVFRSFSFEKCRSFQSQPRLWGKCGFASEVEKSVFWTFPRSGFSTAFRHPFEFSLFGSIPTPSALVDRGRRSVAQTLMQPLMVVELKVVVDARSCF